MSSILKALRKLEEEKADRREGGTVNVARDILRPERRRRGASWRGPVAVAGGVLLLAGGAFSLLPWGGGSAALQSRDIRPVAFPDGTTAKTVILPQEQVVEQALPPEVPPVRKGQLPTPPPAMAADAPETPGASSAAALAPPPARQVMEAAVPSPDVPAAGPAPPPLGENMEASPLVVESIIFHPEPGARMAVINGLPVMQGTVTDGVTIEEILADRIRFSRDGKSFEIRLN